MTNEDIDTLRVPLYPIRIQTVLFSVLKEKKMEQVRESAKIPSAAKTIIVAALDFGTTYSGYAFSLKTSPLDIKTNQAWFSGE